ncbi:hypothetical protein DPMN_061940 [Dreissena polymorpha]|uniref:Uncharacterized protein n=1 Tax=Dreissena polymorpha TaxID=45954 RepID=A0A9D4C8L7_DREPO|nr:hypothetical protein DPMN_061940 [Dreissena polymorpha]
MEDSQGSGIETGSDIRFHDEIESGSLSQVEIYHHLMDDNKKHIYEIKIGIISVFGCIIIIVCLIYIAAQCSRGGGLGRWKLFQNRRRIPDSKSGYIVHDLTENLISEKTCVSITTARDREFFV